MKRLVVTLLLCAGVVQMSAKDRDSLLVMFWNVENFFDWIDQGTGESDKEFSSYGERYWTKSRFYAKCDYFAKSVMWIGDRYGSMPEVIGLAEIENRGVLTKLLNNTLLRKYDYAVIHKESGDRRGIDVALLYRRTSVKFQSASFHTPVYNGEKLSTRDILHADMLLSDGRNMHFIVNHHPSKYGGKSQSDGKRKAAVSTLKEICDSIGNQEIVVMGDFNDTPDGEQFKIMDEILINKGIPLLESHQGTIRYKGKWDLIDFFLTSKNVFSSEMQVVKIPFLTVYDKRYPGEKPLRTYSGPRYIGGVSDHCPVILWIYPAN